MVRGFSYPGFSRGEEPKSEKKRKIKNEREEEEERIEREREWMNF